MAVPTLPPVATFGGRRRNLRTYYVFLIHLLRVSHYYCVEEDLELGVQEDLDLGRRTDGSAMRMASNRPIRMLYHYITWRSRQIDELRVEYDPAYAMSRLNLEETGTGSSMEDTD
ncbi:hypothetical protein EJB05_11165, partial [Eragrostis curvula]